MSSLLTPAPSIISQNKIKASGFKIGGASLNLVATKKYHGAARYGGSNGHRLYTCVRVSVEENVITKEGAAMAEEENDYGVVCMHHVGILCESLERSLDFYQNLLGLKINEARPDNKLPYRGAWLWVGSEMIHLMELPNPDPLTGRAEHGAEIDILVLQSGTCLS